MYSFNDVWPVLWDGDLPLRGKVWFCETATTTSKNIFDKDGNALVNPILTNADGRTNVQVILDGDYTVYMYRYIGTDPLMDDADPDNWLLLYDELILSPSTGSVTTSTTLVSTIEDLKALAVPTTALTVAVMGYYESGDKELVTYTWFPLATTAEDGGSVIASDNVVTGRWILTIPNVIDVRDFGVFPNISTTAQDAYSSQLTSCLTYSEKVKRPVHFSSINRSVVGYSYYSFEGGTFTLSTQKVLIDDNVRFLGKDNSTTTLNFSTIEKNSKLLVDTDHSNGTLHLVSDTLKISWRGNNSVTSTLSALHYIVDYSAVIAGSESSYVTIEFDGSTGLALTASYCKFIDDTHTEILNDTNGNISISNCIDFRVSYLGQHKLDYITITDTNIICDAVLAVRSNTPTTSTPVTGLAYNFSRIDDGTLVCGYFDSNTNVYRVSQYKTVWDALTNRVQILDLEGKAHECVDPLFFIDPSIINTSPRSILNGKITITDSVYTPETSTASYIFKDVDIYPSATWGEVYAMNSEFHGSSITWVVGSKSNFINCHVGLNISTNALHASNTVFGGTVVVGRPYFDHGCNFSQGLTISGNQISATEDVSVVEYSSGLAEVVTWEYNLYVIRGFIRNCFIIGNVDIIPKTNTYNTVVRGLIIEGNTLYDGNFTSSTVVEDSEKYAKGFVISWRRPEYQGMVQPFTGIPWDGTNQDPRAADESPNQFVIRDNVRKVNSQIMLSSLDYIRPPVDVKVLKSTEFEGSFQNYTTSPHITLAAEFIENFIFKLCNDTFTPFYNADGSAILYAPVGSSCSNVNMVYTTVVLYHPKTLTDKFYTNDRWYRIKAYGTSQYLSCETT